MFTPRWVIIILIVFVTIVGILPTVSNISESSNVVSEFSTLVCVQSICINDSIYNHCAVTKPVITKLFVVKGSGGIGGKKIIIELSDTEC